MAITDDLISYYRLDGDATDVASANNGTSTSVTYSTANGKINQGAGFVHGSSSRIFVADTAGLTHFDIGDSYSIAFWCKYTDNASDFSISEHWQGTTGGYPWAVRTSGSVRFAVYDGPANGAHFAQATSGIAGDGTFHHVVGIRDRANLQVRIYVDTVLKATVTDTTVGTIFGSNGFVIGGRNTTSNTQFFTGAVDEFGVWGRVLTTDDISFLYNNGSGRQFSIWHAIAKAAGTAWTKIAKSDPITLVGGSPIGLLLALTYAANIGTQWVKITKASGTSWTKLPKAT